MKKLKNKQRKVKTAKKRERKNQQANATRVRRVQRAAEAVANQRRDKMLGNLFGVPDVPIYPGDSIESVRQGKMTPQEGLAKMNDFAKRRSG